VLGYLALIAADFRLCSGEATQVLTDENPRLPVQPVLRGLAPGGAVGEDGAGLGLPAAPASAPQPAALGGPGEEEQDSSAWQGEEAESAHPSGLLSWWRRTP
jgi:hypothetical protein